MNEGGRCNSGTWPSRQGHDPPFSLTALPQPGTSHPFPICWANFTHLQDSAAVTSLRHLTRKVKCEMLGVAPTHAVRGAASVTPTALRACEQGPVWSASSSAQHQALCCRHEWRRLRMPGTPRSPTEQRVTVWLQMSSGRRGAKETPVSTNAPCPETNGIVPPCDPATTHSLLSVSICAVFPQFCIFPQPKQGYYEHSYIYLGVHLKYMYMAGYLYI